MWTVVRSLAPAALLLALLSAPASTGMVLAHLAADHPVRASHHDAHAADHHTGSHDHAGPDGQDRDPCHDSEHSHEITPATAAALARVASPSSTLKPHLANVREARFDLPDGQALTRMAPSLLRAGPPGPKRHSILLL